MMTYRNIQLKRKAYLQKINQHPKIAATITLSLTALFHLHAPHHHLSDKWAIALACFALFSLVFHFVFIKPITNIIFPSPPWYDFRKEQCQCNQPRQPDSVWNKQLHRIYPNKKRVRQMRRFIKPWLNYWVVPPYLAAMLIALSSKAGTHEMPGVALALLLLLLIMHLIPTCLFYFVYPPRPRRNLSLYYCKDCWIVQKLIELSKEQDDDADNHCQHTPLLGEAGNPFTAGMNHDRLMR